MFHGSSGPRLGATLPAGFGAVSDAYARALLESEHGPAQGCHMETMPEDAHKVVSAVSTVAIRHQTLRIPDIESWPTTRSLVPINMTTNPRVPFRTRPAI